MTPTVPEAFALGSIFGCLTSWGIQYAAHRLADWWTHPKE